MATIAYPVPLPAPVLLPLEAYLCTSYSPDRDFVDGVLEERNLGEYGHAKLQRLIAQWLGNHELDWGIDPLTEQRVRVSPDRVRVVDICILRADAPREKVIVTPPLLCIEILSPEDRLSRARRVLDDYLLMGVPTSWLIDPIYRCAYLRDGEGFRLLDTNTLQIAGTPIVLPLDELFARLD